MLLLLILSALILLSLKNFSSTFRIGWTTSKINGNIKNIRCFLRIFFNLMKRKMDYKHSKITSKINKELSLEYMKAKLSNNLLTNKNKLNLSLL